LEEELGRSELRTINTTIPSRKDILHNRMSRGRERRRTTAEIVIHDQISLLVHCERTMTITRGRRRRRGSKKKLSVGNHASGRDS
jgi:hypothetical protein